MDIVDILLMALAIICALLFAYQFVYTLVALFKKLPVYVEKEKCRYAFLVAANNEGEVIAHLINSLNSLNYPKDLYKVFLVADNCTDGTAEAARQAGANVYERFNDEQKGKGYALDYLLGQIKKDYGFEAFDGYIIFDADNLVDPEYLTEMNKMFSNQRRIITSYRASKNFGSNWISATSSIWFMREARFINRAREILGLSCTVSGTGYVVPRDIIIANDGWKYFKLTEDAQLSTETIINGDKIGYCETAIFYDEQPIRFIDSWRQRLRWTRGFYEIVHIYGGKIFKRMITKADFACYDLLMLLTPGYLFVFAIVANLVLWILKAGGDIFAFGQVLLANLVPMIISSYFLFLALALLLVIAEWNKIFCSGIKKIWYSIVFPFFMLTYTPMTIIAIFVKVRWTKIQHSVAVSNEEMQAEGK